MVTTMCRLQLFLELLLLAADLIAAAPIERKGGSEVEKTLEDFLSAYYDEFVEKRTEESDIHDTMQGDQPSNNINASEPEEVRNLSDLEHRKQSRENNQNSLNGRSKENWIQVIKENLLRQLGRDNTTIFQRPNDGSLSSLNVSQILPGFLNSTNLIPDDQITEKIRSFYPSCEVPENMDANVWKDEQVMNLFFNFDYAAESRNTNVATATLRLYRLPENSTKSNSKSPDCSNNSTEDDRLLRISIYWYTKPATKKRRAKKRLSDSKVITESSKWVELSAKPALRSWQRGRNLGLAVVVEDQEGDLLDAHRYFKGATCTVGASTPRPIPTIIRDAAEQTNKLGSLLGLPGRNSTAALHTDVRLLPTIDGFE
ncbi:unnamed protein product [Callosobruchus maculatus]|uniref:TGF-beta propeptide domain-containing protein n=1 Tax=Callosobruchus maculatus TaxID=64391 RepID=A0A653BPJ9_CALMS|nr:unnamed protein product [Callosobruchus maculatus]